MEQQMRGTADCFFFFFSSLQLIPVHRKKKYETSQLTAVSFGREAALLNELAPHYRRGGGFKRDSKHCQPTTIKADEHERLISCRVACRNDVRR